MCGRANARLLMEQADLRHAHGGAPARDERLREKEFGPAWTASRAHGYPAEYPEMHEQRTHVGKFYFRPRVARAGAT
jgi:hypothetical protein